MSHHKISYPLYVIGLQFFTFICHPRYLLINFVDNNFSKWLKYPCLQPPPPPPTACCTSFARMPCPPAHIAAVVRHPLACTTDLPPTLLSRRSGWFLKLPPRRLWWNLEFGKKVQIRVDRSGKLGRVCLRSRRRWRPTDWWASQSKGELGGG
jgi:hypothetical protein